MVNLGFNIWQGCVLIVVWAVVLIVVILMRNNVSNPRGTASCGRVRRSAQRERLTGRRRGTQTDYEDNKELHWFETFYRVGSIIFGGGQVRTG